MTADFSFVADAAEREPHELPRHRSRNRLAERRLADAGRALKQRIGPFMSPLSLRTARYSTMRSLTLSVVDPRPEPCRASIGSMRSSVIVAHGIEQPVDVGPEHLVLR